MDTPSSQTRNVSTMKPLMVVISRQTIHLIIAFVVIVVASTSVVADVRLAVVAEVGVEEHDDDFYVAERGKEKTEEELIAHVPALPTQLDNQKPFNRPEDESIATRSNIIPMEEERHQIELSFNDNVPQFSPANHMSKHVTVVHYSSTSEREVDIDNEQQEEEDPVPFDQVIDPTIHDHDTFSDLIDRDMDSVLEHLKDEVADSVGQSSKFKHVTTKTIEQLHAAADYVKESIRADNLNNISFRGMLHQDEESFQITEVNHNVAEENNHCSVNARKEDQLEVDELLDDRSLLDIFGETATDYLTHRLIPDTDVECKWDWRILRCEPACTCIFHFQRGDYHLGRSCRRRKDKQQSCRPSVFIYDRPIPKRLLSLFHQTSDILITKIKSTIRGILQRTMRLYTATQEYVCSDLKNMTNQQPDEACWSAPPTLTLQERIFCRETKFLLCDEAANHPVSDATSSHILRRLNFTVPLQ